MLRHNMKTFPSSSGTSLYKTAKLEEPKKAGWLRILRDCSSLLGSNLKCGGGGGGGKKNNRNVVVAVVEEEGKQ